MINSYLNDSAFTRYVKGVPLINRTYIRKGFLLVKNGTHLYKKVKGWTSGRSFPYKNLLSTPPPPPPAGGAKRCLKRQVMSTLTIYFTDIGMNCHIRLCVVSGLEETAKLQLAACSFIQCFFLSAYYFFFSRFLFCTSFPPLFFKQFLLRHFPSI